MKVARAYCAEGHTTFSLLPDCLASRLSSTLAAVEEVAVVVERRQTSLEAVAEELRPDIETQGAVRWVRRRVVAASLALLVLKGLRPDVLSGVEPTLGEVRAALGVESVLPAARRLSGEQLVRMPPCVGFGPRPRAGDTGERRRQQGTGADPP